MDGTLLNLVGLATINLIKYDNKKGSPSLFLPVFKRDY